MTTPERSVEEKWQTTFLNAGTEKGLGDLSMMISVVSDILQAERQRCEEMVEAERERIWTEVSKKTPTLLANYPRGKKDNYNSGRIDGWNICKSFIRQLTQPNDPSK